ncbi:MAG TPA: alpha/beta hydrolase-fold protein [Opitutaceae bacterium]|jgi:hypothetical protein
MGSTPRPVVAALVLAVSLVPGSAPPAAAAETPAPAADGPVSLPRSTQHDFTSPIDGHPYRVCVATPFGADPARAYPVFYVLDGNWYFLPTADNVTESGKTITQAIVVGLGYPTYDNREVARRRMGELASDEFERVLLEEVKPWVEAHFHVDRAHQTLYGKSMGGLATLAVLARHPEAFQTYVAASPALRMDKNGLLKDAQPPTPPVRLLITVGGLESKGYMQDPAEAFAKKFGGTFYVIAGETHVSVSLASLGRAINFALPPPAK